MRILLAPDKFKDALDAAQVCAAMAAGLRDACPDVQIVQCPLADGGEGTGAILAQALEAERRAAEVLDPLGRPVAAHWWWAPRRQLAIVEMSQASGLWRLAPQERQGGRTTSYGTGQLIAAAIQAGAARVLLCVGGSATVDGGSGCLQALGWKLLNGAGNVIFAHGCGELLDQVRGVRPPPGGGPDVLIDVLCDVDNPLTGPRGAACVFGPQKGVASAELARIERGLENWAALLRRVTGRDLRYDAGAGAAGGLPAGLAAALEARLCPGFDTVAHVAGLAARLAQCELVLTGEGRLDEQTLGGKVVGGVARVAGGAGVPLVVLAGSVQRAEPSLRSDWLAALPARDIIEITPAGMPLATALSQTAALLRRASCEFLKSWRDRDVRRGGA